jgi:hypothetical protein
MRGETLKQQKVAALSKGKAATLADTEEILRNLAGV